MLRRRKTYEFMVTPVVTAFTSVRAASLALAVQAAQERARMSLPAVAHGDKNTEWCTEVDMDGCGLLPLDSALCDGEGAGALMVALSLYKLARGLIAEPYLLLTLTAIMRKFMVRQEDIAEAAGG